MPSKLPLAAGLASLLLLAVIGCRGHQYARVIKPGEKQMIGSHKAGQETFRPLVEEAVAKILAAQEPISAVPVSTEGELLPPPRRSVCFVGIENKSGEEIGDFKDQLYQSIDTKLLESPTFVPISKRYVDAGLTSLRLRPSDLFIPSNMQNFVALMEQQGQPFDHMIFATLTSGTTRENKDYQRDYDLTIEMVNIRTGAQSKAQASISKGYHHSWTSRAAAKWWPWGE